MTTSAVCVTGLSVVDVATRLTFWGQLWLLILVQLGGIGILTFTTLVVRAVGRRASLEVEEAAGGAAAVVASTPAQLLRSVFVVTALVEVAGALLLWLLWGQRLGWLDAAWPAVFHAISAFCNAGFSTFSENLVGFAASPLILLSIGALIVIGGIGFPVFEDLRLRRAGQRRHLALSTRIALWTTAALLAGGTLAFLLFEHDHALAPLGPLERAANAFFLAVTPRTAGFNSVDYDALTNASYLLTMLLMWIGGSPASTAGGVKTTTIALLLLLVVSRLRGRAQVTVGTRAIPDGTLQRASGLALTFVVLLVVATVALLATEATQAGMSADRVRFARILFEAQSALGTVGLSMNLTPRLSDAGKLVIVLCMFVGRIGPAALFDAFSRAPQRSPIRLPREDVLVG
jgi:trk system potassium uptake protein TrkH